MGGWVDGWMDIHLFMYETRYIVRLYMLSFAMGIKDKTVGF